MRPRKTVLLALVLAIAATAVGWFGWDRRPAPVPVVSFAVLGYTNATITESIRFNGDWIKVDVRVKNEGRVSAGLVGWDTIPANPFTDVDMAAHLNLAPGQSITVHPWLPAGTTRWQCGFDVYVPSLTDRVRWKMERTGWFRRLGPVSDWLWRWLSKMPGKVMRLRSEWLVVGAATNSPPQFKPLQPADAAPGR
jgi:hypothetical protein